MKNIKLLLLFFVFLPLTAIAQGLDFTTVTTPVFCVNDGSITVTATNTTGRVQYELVNYKATKRSVIGVPQDDPVFLNLAPGTYTVGVYDDNNAAIPVTKEVIVPDYGSGSTLTISSIYSNQLAYCATDTDPGSRLTVVPNGGSTPYTITVLDTNDVVVREESSYSSYSFQAMSPGTYKIRVKDNCGTVVNSNSPHVIARNIVYNFTVSTPMYWYWDNNVKVTHSGAGTICDPVTDAYYDFSYSGGIPVIKGNDAFPISQAPGITRMYAVEYDGVKTPYMTYSELQAYKQPLPLDINTWKPMTLWVSICGVEKSTIYDFPYRKNEFLPKLIANAGLTFYLADDAASTLCTPTGYVKLSRLSLFSGFCDPLTLTITEKNGAVPPQQYTITGANQNDFEAQLIIGNTYTLKLTDINGSELNRFSYVNVTRGQWINLNSRTEVFIDPASFRYYNQDELPLELASMADFNNFGKSQLGIKADYFMPMPYSVAVTGPNGFYMEKTFTKLNYSGAFISDNLEVGDYSVHVTSATGCYDRTFTTTLDRVINSISVTSTITPDPIACDRYVKTFNYTISNQGLLRPYPSTSFESMFNVPQISFKVIDGPSGYTQTNAVIDGTYSWLMSFRSTATAVFKGDITGLYKINLVDYNTPAKVFGGPWELDVKSEFPVFDMNGSGGAICAGSTTGTLSIVVKNATSPVYYLKKATDTNYPATGQSSPDFPNLTAGDYMVKVETACYPTALEASFKMDYISNIGSVITGTNVLCDTDSLNLSIKSIGPIANAIWTLPDGSTQTSNNLVVTNPQAGEYSVNVTTRSGCTVTDKIEVKVKRRSVAADQMPMHPKTCNLGNEMLLSAFKYPNPTTGKMYNWYSSPELGAENLIYSGNSYYRFTPTEIKTYTFYVTVTDDEACENLPGTAAEVTLMVIPEPPVPNGDAIQKFCKETTPLVSDLVTDALVDIAWYATPTIGDAPIPMNTPLVDGQLYYAGTLYGGEYSFGCEGKTRLEVMAQLNDRATAADITGLSQSICKGQSADIFVMSSVVNPVFTWYSDAALTNVIATGENYGVTPTETTTYYVTVQGDDACENLPGTAKEIIISVNPSPMIPTGPDTQEFCASANATVGDLMTNETGVVWYTTPSGGIALPAITALTSRIYYGELQNGTCVSDSRLEVTVNINRNAVAADITGVSGLTLCPGTSAEMIAQTTISNPVFTWYDDDALTNVIGTTDYIILGPLVTTSYYVTVSGDGICANTPATAKKITLTVNPNPETPTGDTNQSFCGAATVADLVVYGTNIQWYDSAEFGRSISLNTPLVNGTTYYAASHVYPFCESEIRLAVTAGIYPPLIVTPPAPQIAGNQCTFPGINFDSNSPGTTYVWRVDDWSIGLTDNWTSSPNMPSFKAVNTGTAPVTAIVTVYPIGTVCGAGSFTFTITVNPDIILTQPDDKKVCNNKTVSEIIFESNIIGTTYSWTNDNPKIGLSAIGTGNIPAFIATNDGNVTEIATITVTPFADGCTGTPVVFTIEVNPEGAINRIENQTICLGETASLNASSSNVINPVFTWYSDAALKDVLAVGATYNVWPLVTSVYYVTIKSDHICEGAGMPVTVIVNETVPPTGNPSQEFCSDENATIASLITNENNVIWHDAANAGNIIPSGTALVNGTIYYGSLKVGSCESTTRLAVTAVINNTETPTGNSSQEFCSDENATIASLITNENNVIWYDAANAGNIISSGTALVNGTIYYGSLKVGSCESTTRLAVTAVINNAETPTGNSSQEFCSDENATIASLTTNENNVIWYDAANAGSIIPSGTALVNGAIYYGSLKLGTCESTTRLAVTAVINNAETPTGNPSQEFCSDENATIASLTTNENNVIWYDAPNAGNIIPSGTALVNGTIYYGSLKVGSCESITRLAVTAVLNNAETPTGNLSQEFCSAENATIASLITNENNVIWYDAANAGNIIPSGTALVNGIIYYGSLKAGTCESTTRLAVTAFVKTDLPGETIGWNTTACAGDEVTYRTTAIMSHYNWIVIGGLIKSGGQLNDDFVTVTWTTAGNGSVGVEFINASNCNPIVTIHFPIAITVCSDIAIGKAVNNPTPTIGEPVIFTITATNIGTSDFQNISINEMLPSGYSYVIATTTSGNYNNTTGVWNLPVLNAGKTETLTLTAKVLETGDYLNIAFLSSSTPVDPNPDNNRAEATVVPTEIVIYNAVSANGDGLNDYFKIEGLQHYPENTVEIYNRWGVKIYEANGYGLNNNVFRGISDGRTTIKKGEVVPEGTYFYILRYKTNTGSGIEKSGYLYVN
ncbi:gliding motility-associated C-terminal domain-containing protein [Flavobacterium sp. AC]|uniref:Gliding motility-associated C-terminal domain-containing protein n=1 Tax=Flavobacterium azizsancarii TaxID=2961580 RepID=A0ABT4WEN3_9FLAO|nr:gliding motility-associated C-terminal domain-containing protein [Flavobacterium azizsancarii]MDA6071055.1 gliding motility-associated C-terminal domain-containing protein [Flavobacterium azizsancarii]